MHAIFTRTRTAAAAVLAAALTFATAGIAAADDISNNLDGTIDATAEVMSLNVGGGNGTTTLFVEPANGDGKNGCNLTGSTTLKISVASSAPGVASVALSNDTFTSCGDLKTVSVTPLAPGSTTVTVSQVSNGTAGTFNFAPATFIVNVAGTANAAPQVTVTGVEQGASYQVGSVPTAGCLVEDAEDGSPTVAPTITGTLDEDGLGAQTAECSYSDAGGLTTTVSATYSIVDETAPLISYTLTPEIADGLLGWWTVDPVLVWTVTENGSPSSLQKIGCEDVTISVDQDETTYSCEATSEGGTAGPVTVTLKRDANGPVVSYVEASGEEGDNGWYVGPVTATFSANDNFSGVDDDTKNVTSTGDGAAVTLDSPAFTDRAGNTTAADAVQSPPFKIDTVPPSVGEAELAGTKGNGPWWLSPVFATFSAEDATSGLRGEPTGTVNSGEDEGTITLESPQFMDVAGNLADNGVKKVTVQVDMTKPDVSFLKLAGLEGNDGWYRSSVTATYTGTDAVSGIDGDQEREVTGDHDGEYELESPAFSDVAGNTRAAGHVKTPVKVDTVPPTVGAPSLSGDEGDEGWFLGTVLATFTATDETSGVAGENPKTVSSESSQGTIVVESPAFEDVAGNTTSAGAKSATFKVDSVAPAVGDAELSGTKGANGWYVSDVTASFTATDATSGVAGDNPRLVSSGGIQGPMTLVSPEFRDVAGNVTPSNVKSVMVHVDTVAPSVSLVGGPANGSSYYFGSVPVAPTCEASDATSGVDGACEVADYDASVGTHTVTATVKDLAGNFSTVSSTYTVLAWTGKGFYNPVDMGGVFNKVKGGSTVPLKFELFAGTTELTSVDSIASFKAAEVACRTSAEVDAIELVTTGGTSLRYDTTGGQFIQNWKVPTKVGCYTATMTALDGTNIRAYFKVTK